MMRTLRLDSNLSPADQRSVFDFLRLVHDLSAIRRHIAQAGIVPVIGTMKVRDQRAQR
jgi:hypothetical protein